MKYCAHSTLLPSPLPLLGGTCLLRAPRIGQERGIYPARRADSPPASLRDALQRKRCVPITRNAAFKRLQAATRRRTANRCLPWGIRKKKSKLQRGINPALLTAS